MQPLPRHLKARFGVATNLDRAYLDTARQDLADAVIATGNGDHQAFQFVYNATWSKLFGICIRICGDAEQAHDILSDVYLDVWRRSNTWKPGIASPISWLATIARNRAIDWLRASRKLVQPDESFLVTIKDDRPNADEAIAARELEFQLFSNLAKLKSHQRDAIGRAFFDGMTHLEIAESDGLPLGTVKSFIRRGIVEMRKSLLAHHPT